MDRDQINTFLNEWKPFRDRTLVVIDFANVEKWRQSTGWKIGIPKLRNLITNFSVGDKELRRFYYGSDYGQKDKSNKLSIWSEEMLKKAKFSNFEIITKRVKYIHDKETDYPIRKCDLDVEMAVDMIKMRRKYDRVILFSGDGDLAYALEFVRVVYQKKIYVFGARDHLGKELVDAKSNDKIEKIFFAEDFEYRLNMDRKYK